MEKLLKVEQVAELLQVSQSLVYKWVHYGFIPYIKVGSILRFREIDLERWIKIKIKKSRIKESFRGENLLLYESN